MAVPLTPRGRPSRGTAGTNPKTGGHQPKDWQALNFNTVGVREFFPDFGECVSEVVRGSSILVWGLGMSVLSAVGWLFPPHLVFSRRLVFSPQGGAGNPNCHVFCRFSMGSFHGVPVTVLSSSIFFNSGGTAQLRSCYPQYRGTCMPGCQRCRFRLNGPDQDLETTLRVT